MILVTGGAGFIGGNFIRDWLKNSTESVLNVDKLTYAGNFRTLQSLEDNPLYRFARVDIIDRPELDILFERYAPRAVIHLAAESHVDRSIYSPAVFVQTNVVGTFTLLEAVRSYWSHLDNVAKTTFRFLHISTDEVFGSLSPGDPQCCEMTPYAPNSPYSATKAASDHIVRSYHHTYGLPIVTIHCSNNYGPYHFPEKLIPLTIARALAGEPLPVYGDGQNVRTWLYVLDHCSAIRTVLSSGIPGQTYNVGGLNEKTNIEVVQAICDLLDVLNPRASGSYRKLIVFVRDRPGHDRRYAINTRKIQKELGWKPAETFESGLQKTVQWYLDNQDWINEVQSSEYRKWVEFNYMQRA
ncbi:dTDP-glucose 4,6-dehydratase [Candidatus Vallotia cooleyia]|uniref:dTDP-glucose 4,6-dehydratase n=1 Tax=Candidatus Vallotiella adelgis TaxID=1177211 RepID=UPI001D00F405|nr:dTDP-glucose 4,6-dehydratase [Candidatus Vallotia cooleyia]UDG82444.1 dTDP-glucose 4,6-dehydratase [Candidatus Vallotia cooleyia]